MVSKRDMSSDKTWKIKNAQTAKLLATIGSMVCMAMAVFMFILSIFIPIEVTINDSYVRGTLPEFVAYPAPFDIFIGHACWVICSRNYCVSER